MHGCDSLEVKCQHIIEDHQMLGFFRFGYGHILLDLGQPRSCVHIYL